MGAWSIQQVAKTAIIAFFVTDLVIAAVMLAAGWPP
jgi:flagellar biosynthesis protein FliP